MRKIKEVLRLRFELGLGQRQIARSCGMGLGTVHEYLDRAVAAGIGWPLPEGLGEEELEAKLFGNQPVQAGAVWRRLLGKSRGQSGAGDRIEASQTARRTDKSIFMETGIAESDFVLIICMPVYATKANKRHGGVGYEAMIITGELAEDIQETKFIPVLREGEWNKTSMLRWLKTKTGADLRGNPYNEGQYNLLVRELHGEYLKPPAPGPKPDFSSVAQAPTSPEFLFSLAKPPEPQLRIDRKGIRIDQLSVPQNRNRVS